MRQRNLQIKNIPGKTVVAVLVLILATMSIGCPKVSESTNETEPTTTSGSSTKLDPVYCENITDSIIALQNNAKSSGSFYSDGIKQGIELDVMEYFSVLTHIKMKAGYTLDYVYYNNGSAGYPLLYVRSGDETPLVNYAAYANYNWETANAKFSKNYLEYISLDGTDEGYFEYAILSSMGQRFYLFWHAILNYKVVVCSYEELETALNDDMSGEEYQKELKQQALNLDFRPVIEYQDQSVVLKIMTFKIFGGIYQESYYFSADYPYKFSSFQVQTIIEYSANFTP